MTGANCGENGRGRLATAFGAAREALGMPSVVLGASYLGFGSLVRESGLGLAAGVTSTVTGWALPGQVALVELYGAGASIVAIGLAVALTNARLLPMTIALMPMLRGPGVPRWVFYLVAHFIAVTGWAFAMRRCPDLPPENRLPYFVGFAATLWLVTVAMTALGFGLAGTVPQSVSLGLVFLNPIYFMLVFAADLRHRARVIALCLGAAAAPPIHMIVPDWGLMITGLFAGSMAFAIDRHVSRRALKVRRDG